MPPMMNSTAARCITTGDDDDDVGRRITDVRNRASSSLDGLHLHVILVGWCGWQVEFGDDVAAGCLFCDFLEVLWRHLHRVKLIDLFKRKALCLRKQEIATDSSHQSKTKEDKANLATQIPSICVDHVRDRELH
jgi:hypothetical protein